MNLKLLPTEGHDIWFIMLYFNIDIKHPNMLVSFSLWYSLFDYNKMNHKVLSLAQNRGSTEFELEDVFSAKQRV